MQKPSLNDAALSALKIFGRTGSLSTGAHSRLNTGTHIGEPTTRDDWALLRASDLHNARKVAK